MTSASRIRAGRSARRVIYSFRSKSEGRPPKFARQPANCAVAARDASADARESLTKTAQELEQLGQRVEAGSVKTIDEIDRPFARAFHAVAQHQYQSGQQLWREREHQLAGHRLRTAADNLERAATATGQRLSSAASATIRESRLLSGKLIEGAGYGTDEVGKAFESLGKQVEVVGQNVEPVVSQKPSARS